MKRIYYFLFALALLCTACEKEQFDVTSITKTEISPQTSTANVTIYVSDQNGYSTSATIEEAGVFLSTNPNPTTKDNRYSKKLSSSYPYYSSSSTSSISLSIEGLSSNTKYYALPFISNRYGIVTGEVVVSFTTNGTAKVTTKAATQITTTTAQLNATVELVGENVSLEKRGFVMSTSSNPKIEDNNSTNWAEVGKTGDYSVKISAMKSSTRYYFRGYVVVDGETLYGNVLDFTTLTPDDAITLSLNDVTDITNNSAKVSGSITIGKDAVGQISECGFIAATDNNPTFNSSWYSYYLWNSGVNTWSGQKNLSGTFQSLSQATTYYYRMYYKIGTQYYYGTTVKSFRTTGSQSSTLGSQVSDFVGMYHASVYLPEIGNNWSWDTVKIYTYTTTNQEEKVCVEGLAGGYSVDVALGEFNATNKALQLHRGIFWADNTFTLQDKGDTAFFSVFYPIYFNSTSDYGLIDNISDGEAWLTFDSNGNVVLSPSNTADSEGHYANGYTFEWFYADNYNFFARDYLYTQLELTKFSSTVSAPARRSRSTTWHAPMKLPAKIQSNKALRRR